MPNLRTLAIAVAISTALLACSSEEHHTEVTLPNGVSCKSEKTGNFWHETRNLSCIDSNGKVIGSYKSD